MSRLLLRNTRKTDSLRRLQDRVFLPVWRRASATFALLRNTRKTDSLRRLEDRAFLPVWRRASAAFALLRNARKTELPSAVLTRVFLASLAARPAPFALLSNSQQNAARPGLASCCRAVVLRAGTALCRLAPQAALLILLTAAYSQVIEFESGGLRYLTQTRNGVTVMFAPMPMKVHDYAVIQVAISNGSNMTWHFKPEDFRFERETGGALRASEARSVVTNFIRNGGRDDVVKLVSAYEAGLSGLSRGAITSGYEMRRQSALAEVQSTKLKAAAAASAIALVPVRLKPGESTDGAVFWANSGKPLGQGKIVMEGAGTSFTFDVVVAAPASAGNK